ncbi:hydrolase [Acetobacteraceae bacterium H6797]|nr:hydrolase [Acetobacteraceae bacterium H6797]
MADHIRIGDVSPRAQYAASGTQTAFTYPFPIFDAGDLEVRLDGVLQSTGFTISGAGTSDGGSVTFATAPAAGTVVLLRRAMVIERVTDFQPSGLLRANTLNDELDRQVAMIQELNTALESTLRIDASEVPGALTLPSRATRANRVLGFDSVGAVTVFAREEGTLSVPHAGAIPRTIEDKLAETISVRDFGAVGDSITDDGPALQAAMNAAAASGKHLVVNEGSYRTTMPLTLPGAAAGMTMNGQIVYAGTGGVTALTIGTGGATRNAGKVYQGIKIFRSTISNWLNEADVGLVLLNLDCSLVEIRQVEGFTIGARTIGDGRGFEDTTLILGRFANNKIGLDVHTQTAAGWNTSIRYYGGHFTVASSLYPTLDRFGIRFSAEPGAYVAHNRHIFDSPNFEMQAENRPAIAGIPFLMEVSSRAILARGIRMEGCSPYVARHTGGAQDHVYEVAWASQGYTIDIDYTSTATRVGSAVKRLHQAAGHREMTRLLADVPNLRAAAIRWNETETGFEKLAVLSTNPSGAPTAMNSLCFPALSNFTLNDHGVTMGGGRALGFVVDARNCREFALAVDADAPRLFVQCFDANKVLLTDTAGTLVRASGQTMSYNSDTRWWQGGSDMSDAALTRLQVVRLDPQVAYAVIGVSRVSADYEIRAMRLLCDPAFSPGILYGAPTTPWGRREMLVDAAWDPPSLAAGATTQLNVTVPGARPGDFVQSAFSLATSGVVFLAQIGASDTVTVTAWNRSSAAIDLGAGTVRVRVLKT